MSGCCNSDKNERVRETVRVAYGRIAVAESATSCGCCGATQPDELAESIGYTAAELAELPAGANLGLSCGNPTALASLQSGEVVLDLGSGGGFDIFIAARNVGPGGRAIGVDMTPEMLSRARRNARTFEESAGLANVEFRLGEIEHLPVADNSVDVVISNCVINLSPDKPQVWREIARVLKPGGRVAVSDLALLQPLPEALRESVRALVGCVAGALTVEETGELARQAGLVEVVLDRHADYIRAMTDMQDPLYREILGKLPEGQTPADYVTSLYVSARKAVL